MCGGSRCLGSHGPGGGLGSLGLMARRVSKGVAETPTGFNCYYKAGRIGRKVGRRNRSGTSITSATVTLQPPSGRSIQLSHRRPGPRGLASRRPRLRGLVSEASGSGSPQRGITWPFGTSTKHLKRRGNTFSPCSQRVPGSHTALRPLQRDAEKACPLVADPA